MIELNLPDRDEENKALCEEFRSTGRCSVPQILKPKSAERLAAYLESHAGWCRLRGLEEDRYDLPPENAQSADPETVRIHEQIERAIAFDPNKRFAFLYDAIPMLPELLDRTQPNPLLELRHALMSAETYAWLCSISGEARFTGIEVQATRFRPGDFLSTHHDGPNADRKIAMVLGLSRDWSIDWGGNLLFLRKNGTIEGITPGFNRLDLFSVPQDHCVARIAPSAPRPRHAISGWFLG
ncbi:MAG: 2OG-Fe(II) oxygenase family protein [Pseudomonadota bacterium]